MWTAFYEYCLEHLPGVIIILIMIMVLLVFCTYKFCKFYFVRFKGVEKAVKSHTEEIKKEDLKKLIADSEAHNIVIKNINDKLDKICAVLVEKVDPTCVSNLFKSNSPLKLTEKGEDLLSKSYLKQVLDDNLDYFCEKLKNKEMLNEGDVDHACIIIILETYDLPMFANVREYLYEHPMFDEKLIGISDLTRIGSIYLRSKYLEKYPFEEKAIK